MLGGMSKNEEIQFFGSQIYFPVIRLYRKSKSFCKHGGICRFDKKSKKYSWEKKPLEPIEIWEGVSLKLIQKE